MRITNGDLKITKDVLIELTKQVSKKYNYELNTGLYNYDLDCPSYYDYQALMDATVFIGKKIKENLTNS